MAFVLKHPLHPHMTRRGNDYHSLEALCGSIASSTFAERLENINIAATSSGPAIRLRPGGMWYSLGEIGLHYLIYLLDAEPSILRKLFREERYPELQVALNQLLTHACKSGRLEPMRPYTVTFVEGELTGILHNYVAVRNTFLINTLKNSSMQHFVDHWIWRPLELAIYLKFRVYYEDFSYGALIKNGETGHCALSFSSVLWTDDELVGGERAITRQWTSAISNNLYRRHSSTAAVTQFLKALDVSFKEDSNVIALRKARSLPGKVAADAIATYDIKARDSAKSKMTALIDDALKVAAPGTSMDVIEAVLESADRLGTKIANNIAEQLIAIILADITRR